MNSKSKEKTFDAVKMMREIRDNLSKIYIDHPEIEKKELEEIRLKYGIKSKRLAKREYNG